MKEDDFIIPGNVIQLGYPPNRIDIITQATGIDFDKCYPNRVEIQIDGIAISVIDVENLKINKQAIGRLQDLADIEKLEDEI
ncbi:hypothetical protein D5125_16960 [Magnetovirga frankeli]|uniref:hypothetical protein n=1 Tax=Magnetovirga frankeli TaxID=947516 RepID=UPI0012933529|nr:hypothetical protein D5125_16960 [gamma proteobacterium SS-5]